MDRDYCFDSLMKREGFPIALPILPTVPIAVRVNAMIVLNGLLYSHGIR
jgi:hypothetical protein